MHLLLSKTYPACLFLVVKFLKLPWYLSKSVPLEKQYTLLFAIALDSLRDPVG